MKTSARNLIVGCASIYLLLVASLFFLGKRGADGHFLYALDDPYIHLALAENLSHGHYGINPTEFTSPSSSVLWPFLLIPFAGTAFHAYVPLCWNILFGVIAAGLIGWAVARWPPPTEEEERAPGWQKLLTAVLLILVANLVSLTLVGMEHVLQVLLAICCAVGVMEALSGRRVPTWCLLAAVIAPSVRYEDLSLTLAVCLALAGQRLWKQASAVGVISLLPLLGLSAFFLSKGLPPLPMSVLVKGDTYTQTNATTSGVVRVVKLLTHNIYDDLTNPVRFPMVVLFLIFAALTVRAKSREQRFTYAGVALVGALQLLIGRFGWFHRYEVYAAIFLALLCLQALSQRSRMLFGYFALGLVFIASSSIVATETTVPASVEVYRQQYQMHRFVTEFYHGNYAVNDLGLVSFQRSPNVYVLDIYGLASVEASRQVNKSPAWLESVTRQYDVNLAMIYPSWFRYIPAGWTPLARMCLPGKPIVVDGQCMVFYSTAPAHNDEIRRDLRSYGKTLPAPVLFETDANGPVSTSSTPGAQFHTQQGDK